MRILLAALAVLMTASPLLAKTLTVYTYDSFVADWGPGPKLKQAFEARCGCTIEFVGLEDAVAILGRLRFEGEDNQADVALGLDTNLVAEAKATGLFAPHATDTFGLAVPRDWSDDTFVPFDYGYFAFIYDSEKLAEPPASLDELVEGDGSLIIQDPRSSSPGLGLMLWIKKVYGQEAGGAWEKLAPRIVTVTNGWSEAYGLFLKGESDMVLSYTTSPAYHITAENETRYRAAPFTEGHYMQIEVAAKLANAEEPELADAFLSFLVSEEAQALLPATQWMYPVNAGEGALPPSFDELVKVENPLTFTTDEVMASRTDWVAEWREALSR